MWAQFTSEGRNMSLLLVRIVLGLGGGFLMAQLGI